jgi:hypothetical protein
MKNSTFDSVYQTYVRPYFEDIKDSRGANILYSLSDTLSSVFAMFSLKSPSLLEFEKRSPTENSNICSVYAIKKIPSDSQVRNILDNVNADSFKGLFSKLYTHCKNEGILKDYKVFSAYYPVSIDATGFFSSQKRSCPTCLTKAHKDGSVTCHHSILSAVLVHPDKKEVFPLANESIQQQDGTTKNDCELNGVKRLLDTLIKEYPNESFLFLKDALYANSPHIDLLNSHKMAYIIRAKIGNCKSLFHSFKELKATDNVGCKVSYEEGEKHQFYYVNDIKLNKSSATKCNFLMYHYTDAKGNEKQFHWITNLEIKDTNVVQLAKVARARWKIENETFNTLKNQGYRLDHNYGHGKKNLAENFANLMFLAFLIDQIQQAVSTIFRRIWTELKTKKKLWHILRTVFVWVEIKSMEEAWMAIAQKYQIRIE